MDERIGVEQARGELGRLVDIAHYQNECTVLTKNAEPRAVLVPYEWYREAESRRQTMVKGQPGAARGADLSLDTSRVVSTGRDDNTT